MRDRRGGPFLIERKLLQTFVGTLLKYLKDIFINIYIYIYSSYTVHHNDDNLPIIISLLFSSSLFLSSIMLVELTLSKLEHA